MAKGKGRDIELPLCTYVSRSGWEWTHHLDQMKVEVPTSECQGSKKELKFQSHRIGSLNENLWSGHPRRTAIARWMPRVRLAPQIRM